MTKKLLMGNEAFAHAALESGVRVVAGYPGTPSSEVVETIAKLHAAGVAEGVHVEWSTNEKAALELLAGASYAGARTLFTCKQMGLNVASDALLSLNYVGVEGACVLFVADDPGPISSQTEQDTRRFADFAKVPILDPANLEQGMDMMKEAFSLSERYRTPVIVRSTTRVSHSSAFVDVADTTQALPAKGFVKDDSRFVIFPARSRRAHGEIDARLAWIAKEASGILTEEGESGTPCAWICPNGAEPCDLSRFNEIGEYGTNPKLGIICGGVSTEYAREALSLLAACGVQLPAYRFMQVGVPFPFPEAMVDTFCEGLEQIFVCEELDHVIEDALVRLMGVRAVEGKSVALVYGRRSGHALRAGENSSDDFKERFAAFFGLELPCSEQIATSDSTLCDIPPRPPVLCAGCPHRGSFYAAKQALKKLKLKGSFHGDIGCYTLGNARPLDAVDTCLCMGAGLTMAQGMSVVSPDVKQLAFIGDSTFFASGMTGVANAVYNQHDVTLCILDNSTTAMTGGQPHPGTGRMLIGPQTEPLSIEAVLEALGVRCIKQANPHKLQESIEALSCALEYEGPSAVVFRAPCVNLIKHRTPVDIDAEVCTGCKRCITSIGCPAIGFNGSVATIDAAQCTGCGLCTQVCPFNAISKEGAR